MKGKISQQEHKGWIFMSLRIHIVHMNNWQYRSNIITLKGETTDWKYSMKIPVIKMGMALATDLALLHNNLILSWKYPNTYNKIFVETIVHTDCHTQLLEIKLLILCIYLFLGNTSNYERTMMQVLATSNDADF